MAKFCVVVAGLTIRVYSARQHIMLSALYRPSVFPSVTRVDPSKTVEVRNM